MQLHTHNAGRPTVRLNLESLESRTLLSSTPLAPTFVGPLTPAQYASSQSSIQINHEEAAPVAARTTSAQMATTSTVSTGFSYTWSVSPTAVFTGTCTATANGKSTGSVAFSLVRPGTGSAQVNGAATSMPVGYLQTSSSAKAGKPDVYNTSFTLKLLLKDNDTGVTVPISFAAKLTGQLVYNYSALKVTFTTPSQTVRVGNNYYTVTLPSSVTPTSPGAPLQLISASVKAT